MLAHLQQESMLPTRCLLISKMLHSRSRYRISPSRLLLPRTLDNIVLKWIYSWLHKKVYIPKSTKFHDNDGMVGSLLKGWILFRQLCHLCWGVTIKYEAYYIVADQINFRKDTSYHKRTFLWKTLAWAKKKRFFE